MNRYLMVFVVFGWVSRLVAQETQTPAVAVDPVVVVPGDSGAKADASVVTVAAPVMSATAQSEVVSPGNLKLLEAARTGEGQGIFRMRDELRTRRQSVLRSGGRVFLKKANE